ncbi:MAG: alanine--glyoxylate aminotransferase family protein [Nitrospirae bacterium]|nr:alanine--glyoxylate aminotransferase family protein [Nitrospirota bacterium]
MMKKYLLAPGPTPVPPEILLRMAYPMIHHRSPDFGPVMEEVSEGLKWLFQTRNDVLMMASSGTGAMEGSVANFLSPGEKVLTLNGGKFGERWGKICKALGVNATEIMVEWGEAVDPGIIADHLRRDPSIKGVYVQASETSTGVAHDVKTIAGIVRNYPDTILVVDAITALGVFDIKPDEWGIDILITGSQKALMLPPGLAFAGISDKAWRMNERAKCSRFYFDFKKERDNLKKNTSAYTPAVSLIIGLQHVLRTLREEGLPNIFARHALLANATREGIKGFGLNLFPKSSPSDAVTAVSAPEGFDGQQIYKRLRERFGITAAGGQDHLKGKIFRISHMGYCDTFDVITAIAGVEMVLKGMGYPGELGSGLRRAEEMFLKSSV